MSDEKKTPTPAEAVEDRAMLDNEAPAAADETEQPETSEATPQARWQMR